MKTTAHIARHILALGGKNVPATESDAQETLRALVAAHNARAHAELELMHAWMKRTGNYSWKDAAAAIRAEDAQ